ncbi:MAG TPA: PQQ-binding-like beta-propeller repeat protein, partial [Actinoplanes sp.]|nr:PQQ-binding-like beta-propeller repeat protein [Actinoplanes sp.]
HPATAVDRTDGGVIELGEVAPGSTPDPRPGQIRRVDIRRYGLAVIAVCCLLAVTGSARPEPRSLPLLWRITVQGDDQVVLTPDALFRLTLGDRPTVTSHDPATGRIRWSHRLPYQASWMSTDIDGLLLLPGPDPSADQPRISTLALDARTGAVRWRHLGEANPAGRDAVLLGQWQPETGTVDSMQLVRPADGRVLWTLAPTEISAWATLGPVTRPTRLVTVTTAGRMEVRRFADGTLITAATVPWRVRTPAEDEVAYLYGQVDLVYAVRTDKGEQEIDAYRVDTLTRLWRVRTGAGSSLFDCRPVLCIGVQDAGVDGRDPRTGRVIWHAEGWEYAWPLADGRLVAQSRTGERLSLIDPDTGRVVVDLGRAMTVLEPEPGRVMTIALARSVGAGWKLTELEPSGELVLRGSLGRVGDLGCQAAAGRVACAAAGGELTVRDLR